MVNRTTVRDGWTRVRFGDVVQLVRDRVDPETSGIERYVAGEHMDTDDLRIRRWGEVGAGYLGPAFHMRFKPGHVLYGSRRTYLRKVALADFEGICANTTFVLESADPSVLLPELLPYVMQTEAFHDHSIKQSKGSVNPYVNFSDLAWYEFDLPDTDEQHRFLRCGKPLQSLLESLQQAETHAITALRATRESLIHASSGPAMLLRDVVATDRPICYGILMPGAHVRGGVPVIKVKDYPDGEIRVDDLLHTSTEIDAEYSRSKLNEGDIVLSIRGTVGRLAKIPPELQGANITQDTARLSIAPEHSADYVMECLQSRLLRAQMREQTTGLAVQGLNIGAIRLFSLPMPPREQQEEVAKRLTDMRHALWEIRLRRQHVSAVYEQFLATLCGHAEK
jgi:type I restriction enzyme S subunit